MTTKLTTGSGKLSLTPRKERAAFLLADGKLTKRDVAREMGVSEVTLHKWINDPVMIERVAVIGEEIRRRILEEGIADRVERVRRLGDVARRLEQVVEERGAEGRPGGPYRHVAGYSTGTMVRTVKFSPEGDEVELFAVDTGMLKEYRATLQQVAQEVGQWTEKREVSGSVEITEGASTPASLIVARIDELAAKRDERRMIDAESMG